MSTAMDIVHPKHSPVDFAWLEITPSCSLQCIHCYAASMPGLGHGRLQVADWIHVIQSLHALGTRFIQFIGGEPTIHPHFCTLIECAAAAGLRIEVYTNLIGVTHHMWDMFSRYEVRIATSFYSDVPAIHDAITQVPGSQSKTLNNIKKAVMLGLSLRVGIIHMRSNQNISDTRKLLVSLGVKEKSIGVDRIRGVGRGTSLVREDAISALCGKCIKSRCAITAQGEVYPCIFSRSFSIGNVLQQDITEIVTGMKMQTTLSLLTHAFEQRPGDDCNPDKKGPCGPDCKPECDPQTWPPCKPDCCPETVASCEPSEKE